MGMKIPTNHFLVTLYKHLPAHHNASQGVEQEFVNLGGLRGSNLVLACFLLQCSASCIRFERFQHTGWSRFRCKQGKRRVRGSRSGYEWATLNEF